MPSQRLDSRCHNPVVVATCKTYGCAFSVALLLLCLVTDSHAQTRERRLGMGGMVGKSAGATIKLYVRTDSSAARPADLTAVSIDLSIHDAAYYEWSMHALTHRMIRASPLKFYLGPGTVFGSDDAVLFWGLSSAFGLFFDRSRFEVFMQVTPRLIVLPELRAGFGSAVGLRYYL